jgi:hypothetical protein
MSEARRDLWPEITPTTTIVPPVSILREQAELLAKKTKGLVIGEITSATSEPERQPYDTVYMFDPLAPLSGVPRPGKPKNFEHTFTIRVPALDDYRYELLTVTHGLEFYPLKVRFLPGRQAYSAESEEQYVALLQTLFARQETVNVLRSLLAQVQR